MYSPCHKALLWTVSLSTAWNINANLVVLTDNLFLTPSHLGHFGIRSALAVSPVEMISDSQTSQSDHKIDFWEITQFYRHFTHQ